MMGWSEGGGGGGVRLGRWPSFLSLELPVWPNETWRGSCPGEGAEEARRCVSAADCLTV